MQARARGKPKITIDGAALTVYTDTEDRKIVGGTDMSEALNRARSKYDAANTIHFHLKLNKNTDTDILTKLAQVANKQGYIKELIRRDLRAKNE